MSFQSPIVMGMLPEATASPQAPLPYGWSEHQALTGHLYYYHAERQQSSWIRPEQDPKKPRRPKFVSKTAIPTTSWMRVRVADGNTFYTNKVESVWEVPDEIVDALRELEAQEEADRVIAEATEALRIKREIEELEKKDNPEETSAKMDVEAKEELVKEEVPQIQHSLEEGKALFKSLLFDKDINPLAPYDSAIPQLINDTRYAALPNIADRQATFDEYCLEKSRAARAAKQSKESSNAAPVDEKVKTREAYEGLLRDELKSTRTSWDDFRKKWKKDRRFFGFGRDDKEREKVFKEWRNSLGERKRKEAQKAEADFFSLLREHVELVTGDPPVWKDVKKHKVLYSDPRYDAVGSSSLREELFAKFLRRRADGTPSELVKTTVEAAEDEKSARKETRLERAEKARKERERQVHEQQAKVEQSIHRSQHQLAAKEGAEEFMTLLTDAVREPTATYRDSVDILSRSPAFSRSSLSTSQKMDLFAAHVARLRERQVSALHTLFESYTPGLNAQFKDLPDSVFTSAPSVKLGMDRHRSELRYLWEDWQSARNVKARKDFNDLLEENQFVGFWAGVKRMGKEGDGTLIPGVDAEDGDVDMETEGEGGGGRADLKALARGIGGKQISDVLKHDKRYRVFDHIPDERDQWIKDFVAKMVAPKLSVHVPDKA